MWKTTVYDQKGETKLVSVSDDGGVRFSRPCDLKSKRKKPQEEELMKINSITLDQNTMNIAADFRCKIFDEKKLNDKSTSLLAIDTDLKSSSLLAIDTLVSNDEEEVLIAYGGRNGLIRIHVKN